MGRRDGCRGGHGGHRGHGGHGGHGGPGHGHGHGFGHGWHGGHEAHGWPGMHGWHGWQGPPGPPAHWHRHDWADTSSSSSSSSSESEDCAKGSDKREKKHCKREQKCWLRMRHRMADPNWNRTQCTLCWHQIKPLEETEVLECAHIYHRLCLKQLFRLALKDDQKNVFCSQCKDKIDEKLVNQLKIRFGDKTADEQTSGQKMVIDSQN